MRLYDAPKPRAIAPRWVLEELGVPYEFTRLDPAGDDSSTGEGLARHALGHVPVMEDGDRRMFEPAAICLHLADRFPQGKLLPPPRTPGRALALQWIIYATTELEPPLFVLSAQARKPEAKRDPAAIANARERARRATTVLEVPLSRQPTLLPDGFSVADVIVAVCLLWGTAYGALEGAPDAVKEYVLRMGDRPARRRATAD